MQLYFVLRKIQEFITLKAQKFSCILFREEAELEYLRIAQDLNMYGVSYFPITNSGGTELFLGITAQGLHVYEKTNKLTPKTTFTWCEIRNISFKNRKFIIKTNDKTAPTVCFYSQSVEMNKVVSTH